MINKSASHIGQIKFKNGNTNDIYFGVNRNTGADIVWQKVSGRRSSRVTGKNIKPFVEELVHLLNTGDAVWVGDVNNEALEQLKKYI